MPPEPKPWSARPAIRTFIDGANPQIAAPTQVRLRMLEVGVCGTDREICAFQYGTPPSGSEHLVIGHESLGEVVEVGKQLLMTRGCLTTFSIANDVAKYFAIIPAAFAATYPSLNALNVMGLASPRSAILSAVVFNALVIVALVPLALRGVKTRAASAAQLLRRNLLIYGLGGIAVNTLGHAHPHLFRWS